MQSQSDGGEEKKESEFQEEPASSMPSGGSDLPPPPPQEDTIPSALEKARRGVAFAAREFYEVQQKFHAAMPRKISDEKEVKEPLDTFDQKMQRALGEEFKENFAIKINYGNFLLDYRGLHNNPFADGATVKINNKSPTDTTADDPDTYSIENLTKQLEMMHRQFSSPDFANTCKALVHSTAARGWVELFVKDSIKADTSSICADLIKPTQYIMRYMSLIDMIKEKTEKLIKAAEDDGIDHSLLDAALTKLLQDQENIKKTYLDPLQESLNLLQTANIIAYELIKNSTKESDAPKKVAMQQAAEKLRKLTSGAKYSDLFDILGSLKKETDLKMKKYRSIISVQAEEYTKEVFGNVESYIAEVTQQKNQVDKDKKSDKVMESLINYMRALETEWEVESKVSKYEGEKAKEINEKMKIARFSHDFLEKVKKEKPLSLAHVGGIIQCFKAELARIDPTSKLGTQVQDIVGKYSTAVNPGLAGEMLNVKQLIEYLAKDKTKIANQLLELKTPGDRRLGQLIAIHQSDHLDQADIEALSAYIALKNGKNLDLPEKDKNKIYKDIKNIRDKLGQASNELAIQQITEINNAINSAMADLISNPQLLDKLQQRLDTFEKNIGLIVVDDLPPNESSSTLHKIKNLVSQAREALPPPSLVEGIELPPPLEEKDTALLARLELRQAILEKRAAETIDTQTLSGIGDQKLKSSYDLMLSSVIKKIDKDFIELVEKQVQYLKELQDKYGSDLEFIKKLTEKRQAIKDEWGKRKEFSDGEDIARIEALLIPPPPPAESKEVKVESKEESQSKEKKVALAMLELRQCLIEQRMANPDLLVEDTELNKDKLLSASTKEAYKKLTKEYGDYRRENFDLIDYSEKIGIYKIGKKEDITEAIGAEKQKSLALEILGEEGYCILHSTKADPKEKVTPAPTTARMLYLQYLQSALDAHHEQGDPTKLITMKQLLGKKGKELYKAAIEEEMADPAFINAVFLKSVENFKGPKWQQKLVLWIAGPSSSGKTFVTNGMIQRIAKWVMPKVGEDTAVDNYVVTIDGAVQRQVSQIRKITVDTAIELGYRGVKDVDKGVNGKLKGKIEEAATAKDDLSIAIPDTFTKYVLKAEKAFTRLFTKNVQEKCELISISSLPNAQNLDSLPVKSNAAYVRSQNKLFYINKAKKECTEITLSQEILTKFDKTMQPKDTAKQLTKNQLKKITLITQHTHEKENNVLHIYSQVQCGTDKEAEQTFELSVGRMGESRAFLKIGKTHYSIIMDGITIIESKKYDKGLMGINFSKGKDLAKQGKTIYRKIQKAFGKETYDFDVTHDLIFITFDKNKKQWRECTPSDQDDVRMTTRRAFGAWKAYQAKNPALLAEDPEDPYEKLDAWLKDKHGGNKPTLKDPIIEFYLNGKKKDHETDNLLEDLQKLQKEAENFLKNKEISPGQFTADEELLSVQQYHAKVSAFIQIIKQSQDRNDKINEWRDYQEDIDSVRKAYKLLIDERFDKQMQEIKDWLGIAESKGPLSHPKEPVDLLKLGIYMANVVSKTMPSALTKEQKKQVQSIITELQTVPAEGNNQSSYIQERINKLRDLGMNVRQFNKIHLAYAAAKTRDASHSILDKGNITLVMGSKNTEEETAKRLTSYLKALKTEWEVEELVVGYTQAEKKYNENRIKLIENAIAQLNETPKTLIEIQAIFEKTKDNLLELPPALDSGVFISERPDVQLSTGTEKAVKLLTHISTQFVTQVKAQVDTRKSFEKAMESFITQDTPVDKYIADTIKTYLTTIETEWKTAASLEGVTEEQKAYNKKIQEALSAAIKDIADDASITLQKTQTIFSTLQADIVALEKTTTDAELLGQTKKINEQLGKLQTHCIEPSLYKKWLKEPLIQSAEHEVKINLLSLGRYMAHLIEIDPKVQNPPKNTIIEQLREASRYSGSNEETQKFIHTTLSQLKNQDQLTSLFVAHAQAIRRDIESIIAKESPKDIIEKPGIKIETPDTYHKHVADKMVEYLEAIKAEWIAQELVAGVPTGNGSYSESRKTIIDDAVRKLREMPIPDLSSIQSTLKELETALQKISSQPTGLARIPYVFSSRSKTGKRSAELISQTEEDILSINQTVVKYITPFIEALEQDKKADAEKTAYEAKIQTTTNRRIFVKGEEIKRGEDSLEIKGTAAILQSFIQDVAEQQPLWIAKQLRKDKSIAEFAAPKKGNNEAKPIGDLQGWNDGIPPEITEPTQSKKPSLDAKTIECRGLPSGSCFEYKKKDEATVIRESNHDSYVQISVPKEPTGYAEIKSPEKKLKIDIEIAEAMVRLWVARCGTPVPISDTANESRMRALIIVCEAHDLHYQLPLSSRHGYGFLADPKKDLGENIAALEEEIKSQRIKKITVFKSEKMAVLEKEFKKLETHYEENLKPGLISQEEKTRCEAEIKVLSQLISDAKAGKLNATAANDAVMKLSKSLAEIEIEKPVSRSSLRAG